MTRWLRECLDSVAAQTFIDWEAICIDDGSADDSGAILDEYAAKDSRFRIIHKTNAGVPSARNDGLAAAQGEWVAFVDSDDSVAPEWFARAIQLMTDDVDLVRLARTGWDCQSLQTGIFHGVDAACWGWRVFSSHGFPWLCFVRRVRIGATRFRSGTQPKEDMLFLLELLPSLRGAVQGDYGGYNYRMVAGSASKKGRPVSNSVTFQSACLDIWRAQSEWAKSLGIDEFVRERLRFIVDHDVWEWVLRPGPGNPSEIRRAYLMLKADGALSGKWVHPKRCLLVPYYIWLMTGTLSGYFVLLFLQREVCVAKSLVRRSLENCKLIAPVRR